MLRQEEDKAVDYPVKITYRMRPLRYPVCLVKSFLGYELTEVSIVLCCTEKGN